MKNKGNQKHLTFEQRVDIEKGLTENKSFAEIGRIIGKNPSTISKEVRLHAHTKERPDSGYTHPPCIHRKNCKMTCLCDKMCGIHCKLCRKPSFRCTDICPAYETAECEKLNKPPYVCNGCGKKTHCLMPRKFYSSKYAHDEYRSVLVDCRVGINQTPESIQSMNDLLVPLIKEKHQSIHNFKPLDMEHCKINMGQQFIDIDFEKFYCNNEHFRDIIYRIFIQNTIVKFLE